MTSRISKHRLMPLWEGCMQTLLVLAATSDFMYMACTCFKAQALSCCLGNTYEGPVISKHHPLAMSAVCCRSHLPNKLVMQQDTVPGCVMACPGRGRTYDEADLYPPKCPETLTKALSHCWIDTRHAYTIDQGPGQGHTLGLRDPLNLQTLSALSCCTHCLHAGLAQPRPTTSRCRKHLLLRSMQHCRTVPVTHTAVALMGTCPTVNTTTCQITLLIPQLLRLDTSSTALRSNYKLTVIQADYPQHGTFNHHTLLSALHVYQA
eukprot:GHUV01003434.1.p1 GENE.GHUV01003434.1~~GHUV01003434.1.p1  ORF type:complete len:263 (-),score=26.00 GHUV01003434.1:260-1048(-)